MMKLAPWIAALGLIVAPARDGFAGDGGRPWVDAARARQDAVRSISVTFKRTDVDPKGAVSRLEAQMAGVPDKNPVPSDDSQSESVNSFVVSDRNCHFEDNHPIWSLVTGKLSPMKRQIYFDGELARVFWAEGGTKSFDGSVDKSGNISNTTDAIGIKNIHLVPLTQAFRGLDTVFNADLIQQFRPSGSTLEIDGRECTALTRTGGPNLVLTYYVDPTRDYVICRICAERAGKLLHQSNIEYTPHPECGWAPKSWKVELFADDGELTRSSQDKVLEIKFNEAHSTEEFSFQFPPTTLVTDLRDGKSYRVQANGDMSECAANGREIPGAVSISQNPSVWFVRHKWLILSATAAAAMLLTALHLIKRKKRKVQAS